MIGDPFRGSAWTRALMGLPASEVHLCGDGSALALVQKMAADMGETLEVVRYERSTPLAVEESPGGKLSDVQVRRQGEEVRMMG